MGNGRAGCLAKSLAGHDKNRYFIILEEDGEYVTLADGSSKTVEKPKRKKKKHVQAMKEPLFTQLPADNETIRRVIKSYERSHCGM